jgi:hypothetical protein
MGIWKNKKYFFESSCKGTHQGILDYAEVIPDMLEFLENQRFPEKEVRLLGYHKAFVWDQPMVWPSNIVTRKGAVNYKRLLRLFGIRLMN